MMKMTDSVKIDARIEDVWDVVGDPNAWKTYHHKVEDIECDGVRIGGEVSAILNFRGKRIFCEGRIIDRREPEEIHVEFDGRDEGADKRITFTVNYTLAEAPGGVEVVETVVYDVHLPLLIRLIVKLIDLLGHSEGPNHMQTLKEQIERSTVDG